MTPPNVAAPHSAPDAAPAAAAAPRAPITTSRRLGDFLRCSPLGRWGLAMTLLLVAAAIFAPLIAPHFPAAQDLPSRLLSPSWHHPFGTDELGRDVLARTLYGARVSLLVGFSVVLGAGLTGLAMARSPATSADGLTVS